MAYWIRCFIAVGVCSYLLGCFNGAILTARNFYKKDIRDYGSKNAGLTNFYRTFGVKGMAGVVFIDIVKAGVSMLIAYMLLEPFELVPEAMLTAMLCCMLGHVFPAFFEFRGGKGMLTAAFSTLFFDWRAGLVLVGVFALVFLLFGYVSLASMFAAVSFPISVLLLGYSAPTVALAVCCALLILVMHRGNIARLIKREEPKPDFMDRRTRKK